MQSKNIKRGFFAQEIQLLLVSYLIGLMTGINLLLLQKKF